MLTYFFLKFPEFPAVNVHQRKNLNKTLQQAVESHAHVPTQSHQTSRAIFQ